MRRIIIIICAGLWFIFSVSLFGLSVKAILSKDDIVFVDGPREYALHTEPESIVFPYVLENDNIVINRLFSQGGILALELENIGPYGIDRAWIVLRYGNELLQFTVDSLPPGAQKIVLDERYTDYYIDQTYYCYGTQIIDLSLTE